MPGKQPKYTEEELLTGLNTLAETLGKRPTQKEMRKEGPYSINAYKRAFDSWSNALEAAEFDLPNKSRRTTERDLLDALQDLRDHPEVDGTPSQLDIDRYTSHSPKTYYRKFDGGLQEAQRRAGYDPNEQQGDERIEIKCSNCGQTDKKSPSAVKDAELLYCSNECRWEHLTERYSGTDNPVSTLEPVQCTACGEEFLKPKWDRERYDRHYCTDCWGDSEISLQCEWCGDYYPAWPAEKDKRRFCSPDCRNDWHSETFRGENHQRWRGGYEPYYGPNWREQRRKALRRDQHRCQHCGITTPESLDIHGEELSVHHIIPVRDFRENGDLDSEKANALENLVSLCRPCHAVAEGNLSV